MTLIQSSVTYTISSPLDSRSLSSSFRSCNAMLRSTFERVRRRDQQAAISREGLKKEKGVAGHPWANQAPVLEPSWRAQSDGEIRGNAEGFTPNGG